MTSVDIVMQGKDWLKALETNRLMQSLDEVAAFEDALVQLAGETDPALLSGLHLFYPTAFGGECHLSFDGKIFIITDSLGLAFGLSCDLLGCWGLADRPVLAVPG